MLSLLFVQKDQRDGTTACYLWLYFLLLKKNCEDPKVTIKEAAEKKLNFAPSITSDLDLSELVHYFQNMSIICTFLRCKPYPQDCNDDLQNLRMENPRSNP